MSDLGSALPENSFVLLARLTAQLASTARLDEMVDAVLGQIVELGFGAVWMAVLDEPSGNLHTLKEVIDGVDTTHEMPKIFMLDTRQPIGHGFRERRMINVVDPDSLYIIDGDDAEIPSGRMALPRVIYDHMRGHPFACGPLLSSRGQPVGALGLSSYRGKQPIPDELLTSGLLRAFMDHLGIAMERALHISRLERLNADLVNAQAAIADNARFKAVGELAAAVAHDLNNLSGIALMAVSVGRRSPTDAHDVLPRIERANRAIGDLVGRLQRVARAGSIISASDQVANLQQIVEDVLALASPILRERSIELVTDLPIVPAVRADSVLIHQVVLNLVLNARDALTDVDRGRMEVRLRGEDGTVRLTVTDNGPGLAPQVRAQLFQPFVTTKPGHVGLGLAAAHASLIHFGGQLEYRDATGGGAVLEVTLAQTPHVEVNDLQTRFAALEPPRRTAKILAVDDDPDILIVVRAYLEPLGYEVTTASTADQALGIAAAQRFDLVLCDVGMPKRSGLDVCQVLHECGFEGQIVLMTGWESATVKSDRRAADCDMILKKPFLGADLLAAIDSLLPPVRSTVLGF
ncbi:MAG: putative Histidine kinase [Myxococcales bacterium]|nr:putative Histidine kinase [Myxococcales bacterium]